MQLSVFSRVGPLSDLLQTVDSYMRMHAKAQVKRAKPLLKWPDHTEVLCNSAIRFEISSSDHGMRSHVLVFLVSEGEKNVFKVYRCY